MVSILKKALDARANGTILQPGVAFSRTDLDTIGSISEAGAIRLDPSITDTEAARQTLIHLQRIRDDEYTDSQVTARCIAHHLEQESLRVSSVTKKPVRKKKQDPALLKEQYGGYT